MYYNSQMQEIPKEESAGEIQKKPKMRGFLGELVRFFLIVVFIIIPFRIFVAQPFIVEGASMDPTFKNGQYLIVDQISYRFEEPERGSVLIFKYPRDPKQFFIKRVIGLPGETVEIDDGKITIFNTENPKGFSLDEPYLEFEKIDSSKITLKSEEYFVMGDNRAVSSDSRYWGPVPKDNIIGRPFLRLLPLSKTGIFPGDYSK